MEWPSWRCFSCKSTSTMTKFVNLSLDNWKQFAHIDLDFHDRLTVITGTNASGKTTLLNLLEKSLRDPHDSKELATPIHDLESNSFKLSANGIVPTKIVETLKIGNIRYSNKIQSELIIPSVHRIPQYSIEIRNQDYSSHPTIVEGFLIPSHRQIFAYQPITRINIQKVTKSQAFQSTQNVSFALSDISYPIKEALMTWAFHGYGSPVMQADLEQLQFYDGFESILKDVLPPTLGFHRLEIRNQEVVLATDSGDFIVDAASGGISALISLVWQIYTFAESSDRPFVVLIDEIENHLHPAMQRSILPDLLRIFPHCQFIVATHSPLVVSSVQDSAVYALRYGGNRRISSHLLDLSGMAQTATEVLREVLDVPVSLPVWVEHQLETLVAKYTQQDLTNSTFSELRSELKALGLEDLAPQTIVRIVDEKQ
jgi:predicted ATP-binding protein involved in virulence